MSYKPTVNELQDRGLEIQNRPGSQSPQIVFKNPEKTRWVVIGPGCKTALWIGDGHNCWECVWSGEPDSSYDFNTLYEELVEDATPPAQPAHSGQPGAAAGAEEA